MDAAAQANLQADLANTITNLANAMTNLTDAKAILADEKNELKKAQTNLEEAKTEVERAKAHHAKTWTSSKMMCAGQVRRWASFRKPLLSQRRLLPPSPIGALPRKVCMSLLVLPYTTIVI